MESSSFQNTLEPVSEKKNSDPNLRIKDPPRPERWWRETMDPPSALTIRTEITWAFQNQTVSLPGSLHIDLVWSYFILQYVAS